VADVLTYVLHYQGALNKNSLGTVSEGAARAAEIGGECHAVVVGGDDLTDELCSSLGAYGAKKVFRAVGPEGLAHPIVDVMATVIDDHGHAYALFGGGLLGFEIARYALGPEAEFKRRLNDDRVIAEALELSAGAEVENDLLRRAGARRAAKREDVPHTT